MYTIKLEFATETEHEFREMLSEYYPTVLVEDIDRSHPRSVFVTFEAPSRVTLEDVIKEYCTDSASDAQVIELYEQIKESL